MAENTSNHPANVIIFNRIQNNKKDVDKLKETFENLNCITTEVTNQDYEGLKTIVGDIVKADYEIFKYIVIIVLDNNNGYEYIWKTTDERNFHINGDLLTAITQNEKLKGKLRFSIMQTNRSSEDDSVILREDNKTKPKCFAGNDVKLYATSTGNKLKTWENDRLSPFIRILCEEIRSADQEDPLEDILNHIIDKVDEDIKERPSKEMNCREVKLGLARPL